MAHNLALSGVRSDTTTLATSVLGQASRRRVIRRNNWGGPELSFLRKDHRKRPQASKLAAGSEFPAASIMVSRVLLRMSGIWADSRLETENPYPSEA